MNKLLFSLICFYSLFLSNPVTAQELNEAFLKSLPKSIQEDFLDSDGNEDLSDNFNERPETRIRKAESGIDTIKDQIQSIEAQLSREVATDDLNIFGKNFFSSYQTSFAPINELNFSADYVLDVGDVLNIQSPGTTSISGTKQKVVVSRDGSINIPKIGQINVAGMPYEEAI